MFVRVSMMVIVIVCLIAIYFFRNLSFTKYNKRPLHICNKYLEETYNEKFTLLDSIFYMDGDYYTWEMKYEDKDGLEFKVYYLHLIEGSEGFFYIFFDKDYGEDGIRDYYWQVKLKKQFSKKIDLESLCHEFDGSYPMYHFDVRNENDIKEAANIITITLNYILNSVSKLPENTMGGYDIAYMGKRGCFIAIDSKLEEFRDKDEDELFQYIYDEIYSRYIKVNQ